MKISVLILTHNESVNISDCIKSVSFSDDIVVLDSFSNDTTVSIARQAGAHVIQRVFDDYASQRNFGLAYDFKHDWIFMLDADERFSDEFFQELQQIIDQPDNPVTLYRIRRKDFFMGRWLKRSSGYPTWFGRFFRKGHVNVERSINEEYYTDGQVGFLQGHIIHYPFNKGIDYWLERHNRYSTMEAERLICERALSLDWSGFFSSDPMLRRKSFKQFAYRVPFRPFMTFIYLYLVRMGFLDGAPGCKFAMMRATYEFMISLKIDEIKQRNAHR